jgi:ATP-binding cassette subfamily B multidrug efflux pump
MADVSTNIAYRFRRDISEKINRMPLHYFDTTTHGEVLSRITNDVDTVNQTLSQSLTQIITSLVTVVGVLIMMFSINWIMTLGFIDHYPAFDGDRWVDHQANHRSTSSNSRIISVTSTGMWKKCIAGTSS